MRAMGLARRAHPLREGSPSGALSWVLEVQT